MKLLKRDNFAIFLVILFVLIYVGYECYSVTHIELKTQTASLTTVYDSINATAIAIRDEHTVASSPKGVTVACLNDGDKINVGGNVAMTFSTNENAVDYSKYLQIKQKLEYYENLESQTVGHATSVESINNQINDSVDEYIRSIDSSDIQSINKSGDAVNDNLIKRQLMIGDSVNLVDIIQSLRTELSNCAVSTPNDYISTEESGVFSSYTDGLESYIDYNQVTNLTVDDVNSAVEKTENSVYDDLTVGKLITTYSWYFAAVVSAEDVKSFSNGDKIKVTLKDDSSSVLTFTIVSGADLTVGATETVLVMKCSDMNAQLAKIRKADIEIRIASYEGIKVPASAVHVSDGKKGVYALISSQVKFREAEVIYSADDYVLMSYDADNSNGIRIYDKIIIQGKDLEDGKVYT